MTRQPDLPAIGTQYGKWTVLGLAAISSSQHRVCTCKCACGTVANIDLYRLYNGKAVRCKKCAAADSSLANRIRFPVPEGKRFGKWLVISNTIKRINKRTLYKCRCDCGVERWVGAHDLIRRGIKSCVDCRVPKSYKEPRTSQGYKGTWIGSSVGAKWARIRCSAKTRDLAFTISIEYVYQLFQSQQARCALSGVALTMGRWTPMDSTAAITASLDRIDSTKGYVEGNVQWVHKLVNQMKWTSPNAEFIRWCKLVVEFNEQAR